MMKDKYKYSIITLFFIGFCWVGYIFDKWVYHLITDSMPVGGYTNFFKMVIGVIIVFISFTTIVSLAFLFAWILGEILDGLLNMIRVKRLKRNIAKEREEYNKNNP